MTELRARWERMGPLQRVAVGIFLAAAFALIPANSSLFFGLAAALFASAYVWLWWRFSERERQIIAFAAANRLRYSVPDPFGLDKLPFAAVTEGAHLLEQRRKPARVMWGDWRGMPLVSFEMRVGEPAGNTLFRVFSESGKPEEHRSIAVSTFPVNAPHLIIKRLDRSMPYRAPEMRADDVGFESDEFERAFRVRCADHRFAFTVIDAAMMAWLLDTPGDWSFEVNGSRVLAASRYREPSELEALFGALRDFRSRVPSIVLGAYAPAPAAGLAALTGPSHPGEPRQRRSFSWSAAFWRTVVLVFVVLMLLAVVISLADWSNMP